MNDVIDRLAGLRSESSVGPSVDPSVVAADVRRGRRAVARRRAVRGASTGVFALAVGGVAAGVAARDTPDDAGLDLVTYDGPQLPGFTVDKVPQGYMLQGATAYTLDVAKPGDTSSLDDFRGKLVVMLEQTDPAPAKVGEPCGGSVERHGKKLLFRFSDGRPPVEVRDGSDATKLPAFDCEGTAPAPLPALEPFDVDGAAAKITTSSEGTRTLRYEHGAYRVVVQLWPTLKLSDAELVEFADGLSVTSAAKPGVG